MSRNITVDSGRPSPVKLLLSPRLISVLLAKVLGTRLMMSPIRTRGLEKDSFYDLDSEGEPSSVDSLYYKECNVCSMLQEHPVFVVPNVWLVC